MRPLCAHNSSTPPLCGAPIHTHTLNKIEMVQRRAILWTLNNNSSYDSARQRQTNLGWRSKRADAILCMLYTIVHGLVAIQLPPYFQQPSLMTGHSHPLALHQIHTSVKFYKYSFSPLYVVQWNKLSVDVIVMPTLPQFSVVVRSLDNQLTETQQTCFNLS